MIVLSFGRFLERSGVLSSHQYSYRKGLGICDALLDIVCAGQLELDRGGELALVQIDFSAVFDRVNHGGLVFKLREAGVGGLILKVFQDFLSSRTQRFKVDGVCSSSIDVVLVCHRVVFLVHCCSCCTLLTLQGCFRMSWLVMLTTLPCFLRYHILVIGHLWQHHWMMIWLWSAFGAVGGVCWQIQVRRGGCLFLVLVRLSFCSPTWWLMVLLWRWSLSWRFWVSFSISSWRLRSKSEQLLPLPWWGLAFWGRQWVFFEMSLLLPNASGHLYSLC